MPGLSVENREIPYSDVGKYQCVSASGNSSKPTARFYFNEDGSLDELKTYNKFYYQKLHPELQKDEAKEDNETTHTKDRSSQVITNKGQEATDSDGEYENKFLSFIDSKWGKILFTICPVLLIWWCIKVPFSWITYPVRKAMIASNKQGNRIWPKYQFSNDDSVIKKIIWTILLVLPLWWTFKLIGNLLTILPRLLFNNWEITNDRFWPAYSFLRF